MSGPISLICPVECQYDNIYCGFYSALSFRHILLVSSFNQLLNDCAQKYTRCRWDFKGDWRYGSRLGPESNKQNTQCEITRGWLPKNINQYKINVYLNAEKKQRKENVKKESHIIFMGVYFRENK